MKSALPLIIFCLFFSALVTASDNNMLTAKRSVSNAVKKLYISNAENTAKITYIRTNQPAGLTQVKVYLDKQDVNPSHSHKIFLDDGMIDANIYKNRLTLILRHQKTDNLLILDKDSGEVIDYFKTTHAAISPSGRFIVYKHWTYRNEKSKHGTPAGVSLVYDVTKSAKDNRTLNHQKWLRRSRVTLAKQSKNAGLPVYPLGDHNKDDYGWINPTATKTSENVAVQGSYYWYQEDAFIFATVATATSTQLVDVVYDEKKQQFIAKGYKLSHNNFGLSTGQSALPAIKHIDKVGDRVKLFTDSVTIRLDNLKQLAQFN